MPSRLGIDVGRTFTDFLLLDRATGRSFAHKTRSTPDDPSLGIEKGLAAVIRSAGIEATDIDELVHGSALPTTMLNERHGRIIGLMVTQGFEQILHLSGGHASKLVGLETTRGVPERMSSRGDAIAPLDEDAARASVRELLSLGVQALTVSLLHSYVNPEHEQRVKAIIREINPDIPVSLSSELAPQAGEYERTLATVMNASLQPLASHYLNGLQEILNAAGARAPVSISQSSGNRVSLSQAAAAPIHAIRSSVAGGATGAAYIASLAGYPDCLAMDMGGISTDICLIRNGMARVSNETALGSDQLGLPSLDVREIDVAGASVAHCPLPGSLRVGPHDAGELGPACFGNGGNDATVTDANVVLGRLPAARAGLNEAAAQDAISALGRDLGLNRHRVAEAIVELASERVAGALRIAAVEKGLDPARMALVASGGAGPLHACALAALTGCHPVIVPRDAAVVAAIGFLQADLARQFARTIARRLDDCQPATMDGVVERMTNDVNEWAGQLADESLPVSISWRADVRYRRQQFQASVSVDPTLLNSGKISTLADRLGDAHQRRFGMRLDLPVELVTLRAIASFAGDSTAVSQFESGGLDPSAALSDHAQVYFDGGFINTPVYDRNKLLSANCIDGPALVTQPDTTTVVAPGYTATVDQYLNLIIERNGDGAATPEQVH